MARKGENIFKRKDGRWEARYIKGHEPSGKARYGFCYGKTYREAKEKVARARSALQGREGAEAPPGRRCLGPFCEEWLSLQKGAVRESTYVKYRSILEKHIIPQFGDWPPSALSTGAVDEFRRKLLEEAALSPKTVKDILVVFRSAVRYMEAQSPRRSPAVEFRCPKVGRKEMRVLSVQEQQALASYLLEGLDACKFGILLALLTGIRVGELCALQWGSISLQDRTVLICATMQRIQNTGPGEGGKTRLWTGAPKSGASYRRIPLPDSVAGLCGRMPACGPDAYVLTGAQKPMEPRTLQYRLGKYARECGLEGVHAHTLRHSFATRCVESGFELKSLSEILGHANTSITLDRYVHSSLDMKRANMDRLPSLGPCLSQSETAVKPASP